MKTKGKYQTSGITENTTFKARKYTYKELIQNMGQWVDTTERSP